jgi:ornithine carbamoyltransferase
MKIVYRTPIHVQIMEAVEKNRNDLGEYRIQHIELTQAEADELSAHCLPYLRYNGVKNVTEFDGVKIVVVK